MLSERTNVATKSNKKPTPAPCDGKTKQNKTKTTTNKTKKKLLLPLKEKRMLFSIENQCLKFLFTLEIVPQYLKFTLKSRVFYSTEGSGNLILRIERNLQNP